MATVTVPVLKPLIYQGRSYVRGESIVMSAPEAAAAARRGEVTLTRGAVVERRDMIARPSLPKARATRTSRQGSASRPSRRSRQTYDRSDMVAVDPTVEPAEFE